MDRGFYIDGQWIAPDDCDRFEVLNPATGARVGSTLLADGAVIDRAVAAAERAAPGLAAMAPSDRYDILFRAAALIDERTPEMARLLTEEQGKPIPDNVKEIAFGQRSCVTMPKRENGSTVRSGPLQAPISAIW
jgi:succinate-semialdehyde dehydrogenase/glutarate-semialdehyde dehydrogenase